MRIPQLAAVSAAALLLTACGGSPLDGKSGPEVLDAAADALEAAGAVHVQGTANQDGEEGEIDMHFQGADGIGSLTFGGVELQLLTVGGEVYLQAPAEFWSSFGMPEDAAATFVDQWVIVPAEAAGEFADFSLDGFLQDLRDPENPVEDEVRTGEVDGEDVVIVEQEDGSTLSVADSDESYPLQMTNEGDSTGTLTFSRFGEKEDISAPEDAVDLAEVMGGA
ncbi:MAG TPA: hypothetical protein VFG13_11050 [Blastococcus sp.]|nr:hypothetical protein [Blastococcus sp.]